MSTKTSIMVVMPFVKVRDTSLPLQAFLLDFNSVKEFFNSNSPDTDVSILEKVYYLENLDCEIYNCGEKEEVLGLLRASVTSSSYINPNCLDLIQSLVKESEFTDDVYDITSIVSSMKALFNSFSIGEREVLDAVKNSDDIVELFKLVFGAKDA